MNDTHGPEPREDGHDSRMVTWILRKKLHKEKANRTRELGAWRHKEYLVCSTDKLAFNLFVRLFSDMGLNFYRGEVQGSAASWWNVPLIREWNDGSAAEAAMTENSLEVPRNGNRESRRSY